MNDMDYYNLHTHCLPTGSGAEELFTLYNLTQEELFRIPELPENCGATAGIHPWWLEGKNDWDDTLEQIRLLLSDPVVFGVGECGLDTYIPVPLSVQTRWFLAQAELAKEAEKPVIIHCVKAYNELIRLRRDRKPSQPWIVHGFRGKPQLGAELIRHGFYLSLGKSFNPMLCTAVPAERLFLETDDACGSVRDIYAQVAGLWGIAPAALQRQLRSNFESLFLKRQ